MSYESLIAFRNGSAKSDGENLASLTESMSPTRIKICAAVICERIHCVALGSAGIAAARTQQWDLAVGCVVFIGAVMSGLFTIRREIVLAVLMGLTIGWLAGFVVMVPLVPLLFYIENQGKRLRHQLADCRPTN